MKKEEKLSNTLRETFTSAWKELGMSDDEINKLWATAEKKAGRTLIAGQGKKGSKYVFKGVDGTSHFPNIQYVPSKKENAVNGKTEEFKAMQLDWIEEAKPIFDKLQSKHMVETTGR